MFSSFGSNIRVTVFGGSHEPEIGMHLTGLPIGTTFDMAELQRFLDRRAPGNSPFATPRKEPDRAEARAGLQVTGTAAVTTADTITLVIANTNTRSGDYKNLRDIPRPGHADYTAHIKYGGKLNMAGGGPFSARMTAPLCMAGGIALQPLARQDVRIGAHIYAIGDVYDTPADPLNPVPPASAPAGGGGAAPAQPGDGHEQTGNTQPGGGHEQTGSTQPGGGRTGGRPAEDSAAGTGAAMAFPVYSPAAGEKMKDLILRARAEGDSVGGVVEVFAAPSPAGLGGPMYDGAESVLAPIFFGIPAVKGVEFGAGFAASRMRGSENNDPFRVENGRIVTTTNHHGGILGGITSGMPLIARLAFKPTPSIARAQQSVSISRLENETLSVKGRHDPCVVLRAVPVCEAAMAIGLLDMLMEEK